MNLSDSLANESTTKMTAPMDRNQNWMKAYMECLINPFSTTLKSPKLLDGEIKNTAALKLRATGEIVCSTTTVTNVVVFPGLTNVICYCVVPSGNDNLDPAAAGVDLSSVVIDGTIFKNHLSTPADRAVVRIARLTGAGARFFLTNSAEEDDGYWEACRFTNHQSDRDYFTKLLPSGSLGAGIMKVMSTDFDLANNNTYQFGQLRDIHKYVFKLNSEDNQHKYSPISGLNTSYDPGTTPTSLADLDQWDMIFIKIRGRRVLNSPSVIRFDSVANQELVYAEQTPLARLMDETNRDPNIEGYLTYSRIDLPAFQAMS